MNRKIPTAIATLIAAFTVAVAIAPVASAGKVLPPTGLGEIATVAPTDGSTTARPNDGRYSKSAEANRAKVCSDLQLIYESFHEAATAANEAGNKKDFNQNVDQALRVDNDAKKVGCSWA